jgi:sugar phosphate permease
MDRKLARKNLRTGLIAGAICAFMFGMTFVAAAIYVHP